MSNVRRRETLPGYLSELARRIKALERGKPPMILATAPPSGRNWPIGASQRGRYTNVPIHVSDQTQGTPAVPILTEWVTTSDDLRITLDVAPSPSCTEWTLRPVVLDPAGFGAVGFWTGGNEPTTEPGGEVGWRAVGPASWQGTLRLTAGLVDTPGLLKIEVLTRGDIAVYISSITCA